MNFFFFTNLTNNPNNLFRFSPCTCYLFHQRHSTQSRSRSFFQTYFHRQHRLNFSLDWPQSRYLFLHPLPDFPDAFSRRSVRLGYPWRRNGGWNSPLKPAAGERLRRFKPRLWCPGQDLLDSRANEGGLVLQPLYALPQLTVFWGSVTQLRYSSEYQRNRNDRYFCVSQSIAISDNVNWFSKLSYFFIYSLNEDSVQKRRKFPS